MRTIAFMMLDETMLADYQTSEPAEIKDIAVAAERYLNYISCERYATGYFTVHALASERLDTFLSFEREEGVFGDWRDAQIYAGSWFALSREMVEKALDATDTAHVTDEWREIATDLLKDKRDECAERLLLVSRHYQNGRPPGFMLPDDLRFSLDFAAFDLRDFFISDVTGCQIICEVSIKI